MGFPLHSKPWQTDEKHEERENQKSTTNLGFQLFMFLRKVQKAETDPPLLKPLFGDIFYGFVSIEKGAFHHF